MSDKVQKYRVDEALAKHREAAAELDQGKPEKAQDLVGGTEFPPDNDSSALTDPSDEEGQEAD